MVSSTRLLCLFSLRCWQKLGRSHVSRLSHIRDISLSNFANRIQSLPPREEVFVSGTLHCLFKLLQVLSFVCGVQLRSGHLIVCFLNLDDLLVVRSLAQITVRGADDRHLQARCFGLPLRCVLNFVGIQII